MSEERLVFIPSIHASVEQYPTLMSNTPPAYNEKLEHLVASITHFYHLDPIAHATIQPWFFADLLDWQRPTWQYLTEHFPNLPHALLFAGNAGTGKRAFVYRFVAWALCQQKTVNHQNVATACGTCESCQWLIAKTHPSLYQLPSIQADNTDNANTTLGKKSAEKKSTKAPTKLVNEAPIHEQTALIKIDDIRELQPFVQQSSGGIRFVIIHQADAMTLGASNALLKTLEEPADNVVLCLISDTPSQLLPTIRSRLQSFAVSHITPEQSLHFMQRLLPNASLTDLQQVNTLSGNAPFVALDMLHSTWYQHRQTWLNTWQALRSQQRNPLQASDYWQKTLSLSDFLYLSKLMLNTIAIQAISDPSLSLTELNWQKLDPPPTLTVIFNLQQIIDEIWQDRRQHIQDKLCYDKLLSAMQTL